MQLLVKSLLFGITLVNLSKQSSRRQCRRIDRFDHDNDDDDDDNDDDDDDDDDDDNEDVLLTPPHPPLSTFVFNPPSPGGSNIKED